MSRDRRTDTIAHTPLSTRERRDETTILRLLLSMQGGTVGEPLLARRGSGHASIRMRQKAAPPQLPSPGLGVHIGRRDPPAALK